MERSPTLNGPPLTARGFSLIESAIVLGLVSLVIGAIWAGASAMRLSNNVNNLNADLVHMSEAIVAKGSGYWGNVTTSGTAMQTMGIVPPSYRHLSGPYYTDPYFGHMILVENDGAQHAVRITMQAPSGPLNVTTCTRIANRLTAWMRNLGQTLSVSGSIRPQIEIYNDDVPGLFYAGQTASLSAVQAACNAPSGAYSITIFRPY